MNTLSSQLQLNAVGGLLSHGQLMLAVDQGVSPELVDLLSRSYSALNLELPRAPTNEAEATSAIEIAEEEIARRLRTLRVAPDFVPAAEWSPGFVEVVFSHLRAEMDALLGAIRVEPLWMSLGQLEVTEPIQRLCLNGGRMVIRVVGEFLVGSSRNYSDQAAARDFFPGDGWESIRSEELAKDVLRSMKLVTKQVAHLTTTRPTPEDFYVYAPSSLAPETEDLLALLREFTEAVSEDLLPEWWGEWLPDRGQDLFREPS